MEWSRIYYDFPLLFQKQTETYFHICILKQMTHKLEAASTLWKKKKEKEKGSKEHLSREIFQE